MRGKEVFSIVLIQVSSPGHYTLWNALSIETLAGHLRGVFAERIIVTLSRIQQTQDIYNVLDQVQSSPPRILGISPELGSLEFTQAFCDCVRDHPFAGSASPQLIFGNKLPTYFPEYFLDRYPQAIVAVGEGEKALEEIVRCMLHGQPFGEVPNLVFRTPAGDIKKTAEKALDLDELVYAPSNDTVKNVVKVGGNALIQASRGCSWSQCSYCTISSFRKGRMWESLPLKRVFTNIEQLVSYGITELEFADDEFLGGRDESHVARGHEIADGLARIRKATDMDVTFRIFLIPHTIYRSGEDKENDEIRRLLLRLQDVGLVRIYIGAESGCSSQLKRYRRGYTKELLQETISLLTNELQIPVDVGFVMFDPQLSMEELLEDIAFFREYDLIKSNQWPFRPLVVNHGSAIHRSLDPDLLGVLDIDYMSYDCKFRDERIKSIFSTIESLSSETRSIFYSLKAVSKRQFSPAKKDPETRRAQRYVEDNGRIYLDLMEALAYCLQGRSQMKASEIVSDARQKIDEVVGCIRQDIDAGTISDPKGFIREKVSQYLETKRE